MDKYLSSKLKIISLLSIILVVFIHAYNNSAGLLLPYSLVRDPLGINTYIQYLVSNGVARIAVPFFSLIAGFLFFVNVHFTLHSYLKKIKSRIFSILIPYLIWSLWGILILLLVQSNSFLYECSAQAKAIKGLNKAVTDYSFFDLIAKIRKPVSYQLWFLRQLMCCALLSPVIYFLIKHLSIPVLIMIGLCWLLEIYYFFNTEVVFFFYIGAFFAIKKPSLKPVAGNRRIFAFIIWLLILFVKTYLAFCNEITGVNMGLILMLLHKISIIVGMFWLWFAYDSWPDHAAIKFLEPFAWYTFLIFVFHEPMVKIFTGIVLFIAGNSEGMRLITYLSMPVFTIALTIIIGQTLKKTVPATYSLITGGRG